MLALNTLPQHEMCVALTQFILVVFFLVSDGLVLTMLGVKDNLAEPTYITKIEVSSSHPKHMYTHI